MEFEDWLAESEAIVTDSDAFSAAIGRVAINVMSDLEEAVKYGSMDARDAVAAYETWLRKYDPPRPEFKD